MKAILLLGFLAAVGAAEPSSASCDKSKCPNYIFSHYDGKGCTPVVEDGCCPSHFDCSKFLAEKDEKACVYKGREYHQGENITTTNPCHKCACGPDPSINCAITDCFQERPDPDCVPLFDHNSCCPKGFKCLKDGEPDGVTCKYENKIYVEGQIMIMKEDPCMQCLCDPSFKGPGSPSCRHLECNFPGHGQRFRSGCIPVYFENQCCYIDWHCPPPAEDGRSHPPPPNRDTCSFGALTFQRGENMELGDPCVTCSCRFPPDLSCVRTKCGGPPPDMDPNFCRAVPKPGQCCPEFICQEPGASGDGSGSGSGSGGSHAPTEGEEAAATTREPSAV